jgi:hypothetical protein
MAFLPLLPADDATLHWRQPKATRYGWQLEAAEDRVLGELEFASTWSEAKATAATATGRWQFEWVGRWKPKAVVRADNVVVASLEIVNTWLFNRAALVAPDGRPIAQWDMTSFLGGTAEWQDDSGARLITYRHGTDEGGPGAWWRTQCRVDFTPAGFAHSDRDQLLTLGWYVAVIAGDPGLI